MTAGPTTTTVPVFLSETCSTHGPEAQADSRRRLAREGCQPEAGARLNTASRKIGYGPPSRSRDRSASHSWAMSAVSDSRAPVSSSTLWTR